MSPDTLDPKTNETALEQVFKSDAFSQEQANDIITRFKNSKTGQFNAGQLLKRLGDSLEINGQSHLSACALKIIAERIPKKSMRIYSLTIKKLQHFNTHFGQVKPLDCPG